MKIPVPHFKIVFLLLFISSAVCAQISESQQHYLSGVRFSKQLRWDEAIGEYDLAIEKK
jgi:hypothetical protein